MLISRIALTLCLCAACHHEFAGTVDQSVPGDAARRDGKRDGPAAAALDASACVSSSAVGSFSSGAHRLIVCEADPVDRPTAATLCGESGGWHLCSTDEYERFFPAAGSAPPPVVQGAWLGGCLENGQLLASGPCAPEVGDAGEPVCPGQPAPVAVSCSKPGDSASSEGCSRLGLVAADRCWKLSGKTIQGVPRPSFYGYGKALCCK